MWTYDIIRDLVHINEADQTILSCGEICTTSTVNLSKTNKDNLKLFRYWVSHSKDDLLS